MLSATRFRKTVSDSRMVTPAWTGRKITHQHCATRVRGRLTFHLALRGDAPGLGPALVRFADSLKPEVRSHIYTRTTASREGPFRFLFPFLSSLFFFFFFSLTSSAAALAFGVIPAPIPVVITEFPGFAANSDSTLAYRDYNLPIDRADLRDPPAT